MATTTDPTGAPSPPAGGKGKPKMAKPTKKPAGLGVAAAEPPPEPADKKPARKRRMHLSIRHPDHGRLELHLKHWGESVALDGAVALADAGDKPVWIQLAKVGQFAGHAAGPFKMGNKEFGEMVANFRSTENRRIPIDFEHASEAEATAGSIPTEGAPAQGWIVDLDNRGAGGLWGLVEWGAKAREYIQSGAYRFISPAVRFNSKDRVTGKSAGARLTSAGLTNQPFLDGMQPLAAKDTPMGSSFAYSSHEVFPALRAAMKLPEVSTPQEMSAQCARLRQMAEDADHPLGMAHGVDLSQFLPAMRDAVRASMGATWDDVFDAIEDMIDAAIGEHVEEEHEDTDATGASMSDSLPTPATTDPGASAPTGAPAPQETTTMAADQDLTIKLRDAEARATDSATKLSDALTKQTELTLTLKERDTRIAELEANELKLKDEAEKRLASDREAEVVEAIAVYKDKKGISEADKPDLLALLTAAPASFRKLYPPVKPEERHLLRTLATDTREGAPPAVPGTPGAKSALSVTTLAKRLMKDNKSLSLAKAQNEAAKMLRDGTAPLS